MHILYVYYVITEGLIVEQFCYKLGLILSHIAAWNTDQHSQVLHVTHLYLSVVCVMS